MGVKILTPTVMIFLTKPFLNILCDSPHQTYFLGFRNLKFHFNKKIEIYHCSQ